jgi:hypothetical protein
MAVSSLSRMTVPLASDQSAPNQGLLMPKLKYRFRVMFENFGISKPTTELTKQVMSFSRPNLSFEEITLPIYNSTLKLAGKHSWTDATCEVRDDASNSVAKLIGEQLQKQMDFVEQASAATGQDYKFQTNIEILDGGNGAAAPQVLETWECSGCFLQVATYGSLNYTNSEAVTIQMQIRYDNAIQAPLGSGVGTNIGRILGGSSITGIGAGQGNQG